MTRDVKSLYRKLQGLFDDGDRALLLLVGTSGALGWLSFYLLLREGRGVRFVALLAGFSLLLEIHHLLRSLAVLRYTAGIITAIPLVLLGILIIRHTAR